jgi:hypothetical protein
VRRRETLATAAAELRAKLDIDASSAQPSAAQLPAAPLPSEPPFEWFRGDAHALLRSVYTDPRWPIDMRIDAAKSAIRFERPALVASHVQHSNAPSREMIARMSIDQIKRALIAMDADDATIDGEIVESVTPPEDGAC